MVFAVLVGINVYVFFFSPDSLRMVAQAAETVSIKAGRDPRLVLPPPVAVDPTLETREVTLREGEGLGAALRREGLAASEVAASLRALRRLLDFKRDLRPGQKITLRRDSAGRLVVVELRAGKLAYAVHRAPDGRLLGGKGPLAKAPRVSHH
jgi:hypothetical protein